MSGCQHAQVGTKNIVPVTGLDGEEFAQLVIMLRIMLSLLSCSAAVSSNFSSEFCNWINGARSSLMLCRASHARVTDGSSAHSPDPKESIWLLVLFVLR